MEPKKATPSPAEFERMALELDSMADLVRERPDVNHHFAERLSLLAKEMRENAIRVQNMK